MERCQGEVTHLGVHGLYPVLQEEQGSVGWGARQSEAADPEVKEQLEGDIPDRLWGVDQEWGERLHEDEQGGKRASCDILSVWEGDPDEAERTEAVRGGAGAEF